MQHAPIIVDSVVWRSRIGRALIRERPSASQGSDSVTTHWRYRMTIIDIRHVRVSEGEYLRYLEALADIWSTAPLAVPAYMVSALLFTELGN